MKTASDAGFRGVYTGHPANASMATCATQPIDVFSAILYLMRPGELLLRCYAEEKMGHWQAFCLDLGLAAQGESEAEACGKLNAMIHEYLHDALTGEDREYAEYFLTRKAPFDQWARYYLYFAMQALHIKFGADRVLFKKLVPLAPSVDSGV